MKLVIIGGGIAGVMAAGAFANEFPVIFEAQERKNNILADHKAVMRIRDPRVALLLGCSVRPITVKKAVYYGGRLLNHSNITTDNLYSLKTYGQIGVRSLSTLQDQESTRFLLQGEISRPCNRGHKLVKVHPNKQLEFVISSTGEVKKVDYDFCISTIPLPALARCCDITFSEDLFRAIPIYVVRALISIPCSVHQTIYVPELQYSTYRATLQEQDLILEGIAPISEKEIEELVGLFGLSMKDVYDVSEHKQEYGKLLQTDESARRHIIHHITKEFRVFSFGRFGIWKPIRTDHLISDLERIKQMMDLVVKEDNYSIYKHTLERI